MNVSQKFSQLRKQCAKALQMFYYLRIVAILLVNVRRSLHFYRFELVQSLVCFDLRFHLFRSLLIYFADEATSIVRKFFLNFEEK